MRLQPVLSPAAVCLQGDMHAVGFFHFFDNYLFHPFFFVDGDAEVEFVVHLQNHLCPYSFGVEAAVDACHCHLDNVGCTALNRGVDGVPLGISTYDGVARVDVGQETLAVEDGFYVSSFARHVDALVLVCLHLRIGLEVTVYQLFGFFTVDVHPFGKPED